MSERLPSVSVCIPAHNEAGTIQSTIQAIRSLQPAIVTEVVVVDDSTDATARLASRAGATVYRQEALMPAYGRPKGKGDAMWRAVSVAKGDIICFFDADLEPFDPLWVARLLLPFLSANERIAYVKSAFRRPLAASGGDDEGGRVTALTAKPLLREMHPELDRFAQPLSGQIALTRQLARSLPFFTGYGVDIGLLIDAYGAVGLQGMAEVQLGVLHNRHQDVVTLGVMATQVVQAVFRRSPAYTGTLAEEAIIPTSTGVDVISAGIEERPPLDSLPSE